MNVLNKIWPWSEIKRLKGLVKYQDIEIEARRRHNRDEFWSANGRIAELEAQLKAAQKNDTRDSTGRFTKKAGS